MDNAVYTALTRQSGLMAEMQAVANNIANASTTGYRREGVVFAEFVAALAPDDPSLSMATAQVRDTRMDQAPVTFTGGSFDLAIEGDGFFMVEGPEGPLLLDPEAPAGRYPPAEKVVDTTAAGDSFNAGFLAALLNGATEAEAAQAAHALALQVIGVPGAILP